MRCTKTFKVTVTFMLQCLCVRNKNICLYQKVSATIQQGVPLLIPRFCRLPYVFLLCIQDKYRMVPTNVLIHIVYFRSAHGVI